MGGRSRPFFSAKGRTMIRNPQKPLIVTFLVVSLLILTAISSRAEDLLPRAAMEFREKNYGDAFTLAQKSIETPQRNFLLGVAALAMRKRD